MSKQPTPLPVAEELVQTVLQAVLENAPLPLAQVAGPEHIVWAINPAFCTLLSRSAEELIGQPFADLFPQSIRSSELLDRVLRSGVGEAFVIVEGQAANSHYGAFTCWPINAGIGRLSGLMIQVTETTVLQQLSVAVNEALLISSVEQHELADVAERLNVRLQSEIIERQKAEEVVRESEARLALGLRVAQLALAEVDYGTGQSHLSAEAAQMFGLGEEAMVVPRATVHATFHPDDRAALQERIAAALDPNGPGRFEMDHRVVWPNGRVRWLRVSKHVLFNTVEGTKRPSRAILAALDISREMEANSNLRASDVRVRLATEATGVGIWEWNILSGAIRWDAQMFRIYGITPTPDGVVPYSFWSNSVVPEDLAEQERILQDTVGQIGQSNREFRIQRTNDHAIRYVEAVETVRTNLDEKAEWVLGTNLDITERKQAEFALLEADRRQSEFLATLAHELRNPLAPLRNGLELLSLSDPDRATSDQTLGMMKRQLDQMVRLIDDLMDLSRISRGTVDLRMQRLDLRTALDQAVETCKPLIDRQDHTLVVDLPDGPVMVEGDPMRLTQVFTNLLNNSAKYTDRGGAIAVHLDVNNGEATVSIEDNGIGIAADQLVKVFDMFAQVERTNDRVQGGLGIGLNIVKHLVGMHGGHITARSEGLGKGSGFTVCLPLAVTPATIATPPEPIAAVRTIAPQRILVVDDNVDAATMMALLLGKQGHEVRVAHNGEEALKTGAAMEPDVVLMDLGMPVMDGFAACRLMRASPWGAKALIVALSGWGQEEDRRKSTDAGFDNHLVKPIPSEKILALIEGHPPAPSMP